MWRQCCIEQVNGSWGIYWPDCTLAWNQKFKTKGWATRTLNWLIKGEYSRCVHTT